MSTVAEPVVRGHDEGEVAWLGGFAHLIKLSGAETDNVICVVECDARRDDATPWHVHHEDDETFYVLEGEITFYSGESSTQASAGTLVHLRREIPHAFVVESETARFLVIGAPAKGDLFFREAGTPERQDGPPDIERMARVAAEYG